MTKGWYELGLNYGVSVYSLAISENGVDWFEVPANEGGYRFPGNTQGFTEVRHVFERSFSARFVRLTVEEILRWGMMKWAIEGCPRD